MPVRIILLSFAKNISIYSVIVFRFQWQNMLNRDGIICVFSILSQFEKCLVIPTKVIKLISPPAHYPSRFIINFK